MYVVTDSNDGEKFEHENVTSALLDSLSCNHIYNDTIRGAIVTALHWIEYQED